MRAPGFSSWNDPISDASRGLNRLACRAAVVVPDLDAQPAWRDRLRAVCGLVDVELVEVPHQFAALR